MEKNLEHKIKEAFQKKDSTVEYSRKDELWNRIENQRNSKRGVSAIWRVAAILFAIFFITAAIAGILVIDKNQNLNFELKNEINRLKHTADSLQNIQPKILTETKIVEKEVPVYLQSKAQSKTSEEDKIRIEELSKRNSSLQLQLISEKRKFQHETDSLKHELLALQTDMQKTAIPENQRDNESNLIELISENYDTLYQQKPKTENPKLKLQLFNNPAQNEQIQMNSNIFKK